MSAFCLRLSRVCRCTSINTRTAAARQWRSTIRSTACSTMLMIHNPMTAAFGNSDEMQKAIEMLSSVKDSIINAYEIKTGLSRAKLSHLMDAETWMDANKAVELGFADEIMQRSPESEEVPTPTVSMLYSKANVVNSLMEKIAAKCAIDPKSNRTQKADDLMDRLNLIKNWR